MKKSKKLLALILTLILIFAVIPTTALSVSAETVKVGYIAKSYVNVRKDATTSSESLAKVTQWWVTVLGSKKDTKSTLNSDTGNTYVWYKVTYTSSGETVTGYVREDYIKVAEYTLDPNFAKTLSDFPESYHSALIQLHAMYPNWTFKADKVGETFANSVTAQDTDFTKLTSGDYLSHLSMRDGCYNWETGKFIKTDTGKYGASREVIAYYMDPRNFLNANDIFVYMQQSYDSTSQTLEGIQKIVAGTFLDAKITNSKDYYYGKTFAYVINIAARESNVNPYILASTIIQEQGRNGSAFSKGTTYNNTTVYNFFNYGASGSNSQEVLKNGAKYAYEQEWITASRSIISGAVKYGSNYINAGQDTYFYKNFNVLNPDRLWHQYAQSVADSLNSSRIMKTSYIERKDVNVTFRIPVFESMPTTVSKLPQKTNKLNNYYFNEITANGLTPSFNKYTNSYSLKASGNIEIYIDVPSGAVYTGASTYTLKKGANNIKLKVKSQTGYSRTYSIKVTASVAATLTVKQTGGTLIKEADGNYYYYLNGKKTNSTTLVKYGGVWFYVENGVWNKTAETVVKYKGVWFYVKNGRWDTTGNTLVKYNGNWLYIKNGRWDNTARTLIKYNGYWFFVEKGVWNKTAETVVKYNNVWFYVKNGKWDTTGHTLVKYGGNWLYIKNGRWSNTANTYFTYKNVKFKIVNGVAQV